MKHSIKTLSALVVIVLVAVSAGAKDKPVNWDEVRVSSDGRAHDYVDMDSIDRSGETVRIRIRSEFAKGFNNLSSGEGTLEVDCKANRARFLTLVLVDERGREEKYPDPGAWQPVVDTSPAYYAAQIACVQPEATSNQPHRG